MIEVFIGAQRDENFAVRNGERQTEIFIVILIAFKGFCVQSVFYNIRVFLYEISHDLQTTNPANRAKFRGIIPFVRALFVAQCANSCCFVPIMRTRFIFITPAH